MDYFDDLLNVYGYLRHESRLVAENLSTAFHNQKYIEKQNAEVEEQLKRASEKLLKIADYYGIQMEDRKDNEILPNVENEEVFKKIALPGDFDYEQQYRALVFKAKEAGFVNVHPEELLTAEEMAFAEEFNRKLDQQFAAETSLSVQDMFVVGIGIALHLLRLFLPKAAVPEEEAGIGKILASAKEYIGTGNISVKTPSQILEDTPIFQCFSDRRYPERSSVLGYDPVWGWLFGVYNIMTGTVTFSDMRTFGPEASTGNCHVILAKECFPLREVIASLAAAGTPDKRDEIIAAVIREAFVLIPRQVDFADMAEHYDYCCSMLSTLSQGVGAANSFWAVDGLDRIFAQADYANAINMIIIAIHGLMRSRGESIERRRLKAMKVVTIANFVSSVVGSLHVLVDQNYLDADWSGLATSLIEAVRMKRMWVDLKAEFLSSSYLPQLQEELSRLDKYFKIY